MTEWPEALDGFEERLDEYRAVLEDNESPNLAPWPPDDITGATIPDDLVPRARELLEAANALEKRLLAARASFQLPAHPGRWRRRDPGRPTISTEL